MKARNDKEWHKIVCEENNWTCYLCGRFYGYEPFFNDKGVNQYVCGDHIKTKGSHPELRLETDNGRCVCNVPSEKYPAGCHNHRHSHGQT